MRPENRAALSGDRSRFREMTLQDLKGNDRLAWGRPDDVLEKLMAEAESLGSNTLLLSFNRGAMPHEMFMAQLQRFGEEVLPALRAHEITKVPV